MYVCMYVCMYVWGCVHLITFSRILLVVCTSVVYCMLMYVCIMYVCMPRSYDCRMPRKAASSPSPSTWQVVVAWLLGLWLAAKLLFKIEKPKEDLWNE